MILNQTNLMFAQEESNHNHPLCGRKEMRRSECM